MPTMTFGANVERAVVGFFQLNHGRKIRTENHLRTEHSESDSDPQTWTASAATAVLGLQGCKELIFSSLNG